jgi:protein-tyrosine-phosphatase
MKLIVFVCTANACRSPMAEGLLREQLEGRFPDVEIASAGTLASRGGATPEGVRAAAELGADISRHRSQAVTEHLMSRAALVIAMTREHASWLRRFCPAHQVKVVTLGELARGPEGPDVPDPIGSDLETYRRIAQMIQKLLLEAETEILKRFNFET